MHRTFAGYASKCVINPRYFLVVFVCPSIRKDFALNFTDVCVGSRENPLHFEDAPDYARIMIGFWSGSHGLAWNFYQMCVSIEPPLSAQDDKKNYRRT